MSLKIHEILIRDPRKDGLANDGQARIRNESSEHAEKELRAELSTFVCDGQYGIAMERILAGYLKHLDRNRQVAVWVSGFFGSGKSHLLKMLGHLRQNTPFSDGITPRSLVVGLPSEVVAQLKELDSKAKRHEVSRFMAMGTLPAGSGEYVRATIAAVVLEARGLPRQVQFAEFVFWLRSEGIEEQVRKAVQDAKKDWISELNDLYVSTIIAKAVLAAKPGYAASESEVRKLFIARFAGLRDDVETDRFIKVIRSALSENGTLPLTVLVLDEIQQYIADSNSRSTVVTEAIEALITRLDSRVLVVGAGQSALSVDTPTLTKLRDRFDVTVELSDSDVEAVTRKVVLAKKPVHESNVRQILERHSGEISRQLVSSARLSQKVDDAKVLVVDYPLLPTRRRFWEACFRALDAGGTHSQLRSQLKIVHQAVLAAADKDVGYVIPGDSLYLAIADKLVNTGVLLPELYQRIEKLKNVKVDGQLLYRMCGLVFLIMKLPREAGTDIGLRATPQVIADLLVEDITVPSEALRNKVATLLDGLATDGTLMKVGDEFRLQTGEGEEWNRAFIERVSQLMALPDFIEDLRRQKFREEAQRAVVGVNVKHGVSKVLRNVTMHFGISTPPLTDNVVIWMRDGWETSERDVLDSARALGQDDSTIHVFIPKKEADGLRRQLADAGAAQRVLDNKGVPTNTAGQEASASISSRKIVAENSISETVKEVFRGARVFQGGGTELTFSSLTESLQQAARDSVARRYPRFSEADFAAWETVIQRAKTGSDDSFAPIGHSGVIQDHSVSKEVLRVMGTGETGTKIRKALEASPFGWPKDAIDAALIALHRVGVIRVSRNSAPIQPGALDQGNIPTSEFKPEQTIVTVGQKLSVRSLCTYVKCPCKTGEEEMKAGEALKALEAQANRAGGEAPRPAVPSLTVVKELVPLSGAERIVAVAAKEIELKGLWDFWTKQADQIEARMPAWLHATQLVVHAEAIPELADALAQLKAVDTNRGLLNDPDPVAPIATTIANTLRSRLSKSHELHAAEVIKAQNTLDSDASWQKLKPEQQKAILATHKIVSPSKPTISTDAELLESLAECKIDARENLATVVRAGISAALTDAAKILKPAARSIKFAPATLENESQVESWIAERKKQLLEEIKTGPVILG
jgi:hypothetical protein